MPKILRLLLLAPFIIVGTVAYLFSCLMAAVERKRSTDFDRYRQASSSALLDNTHSIPMRAITCPLS